MTLKPWSYAVNPFIKASGSSYANTQRINHFHLAALNTAQINDVFFVNMYNDYKVVHDAFETAYTDFLARGGTQQGSGESLAVLLAQSTVKITHWDALIQVVYSKGSARYIALLPNGHSSFTKGSQESRINAVKAFSTGIGADASLSTVKAEADTYWADLNAAFIQKNEDQNKTSMHSDACDAARINLCRLQYANLGALMAKFCQTPEAIDTYFDLENIRTHQQTDFTHSVKPAQIHTIVKRALAAEDQIRISNKGNTVLRFYVAGAKDEAIGTIFIEAAPGSNHDYAASLLGDVVNNRFIMVYNPDAVQSGSFVLDML